jgi:hypothetical protein
MTDEFVIPERLTEIPSWWGSKNYPDEEQVAKDIVSAVYWRMIDERAKIQALAKTKKLKGWNPKLSPEQQSDDICAQFSDNLSIAVTEITELLGKDIYARARALAEGSDASYDFATMLGDVAEQVQTRIAMDIKEQGLLTYLEYGGVEEYLLSKRDEWDGTGKRPGSHYEIAFMVNYLIPTLEANGFPRKMLLGVAQNFHKARFASAYLKEQLADIIVKMNEIRAAMADTEDEDEKVLLNQALEEAMQLDPRLKESLDILIDEMSKTAKQGGMSALDFREAMRKTHRQTKEPDKVLGYIYNLSKGGVMMISCDDKNMLEAIKLVTSKFVDWHLGTPEDLAKETAARLLKSNIKVGDI